ncbi:DUF5954 family protein [Streptomyces sp. NPDC059761]|uniref:DUF5954 family protein n=1 Tax=Streptomyces sp. NPDC059761 TaxID=3346937 RepID=UPI0036646290
MDRGDVGRSAGSRPMVVRVPVEPVEAAAEADAADANARAGDVVVRGPVFGVAVQGAGDEPRWRVVSAVTDGCPQQARDGLNSLLWFRAKDDAYDRAERRALLAAVARLESERVDEIAVAGSRYRIVRAEEYAVTGPDGIEGPRPTDPEPPVPDWSHGKTGPDVDDDLVLDPDAPVTPAQAIEQLALRGLSYSGGRFPKDVRSESQRALDSHPDVFLLPPSFTIVERSAGGWTPVNGPHVSAHAARKALDFSLTWMWPRMRGLIPYDADMHADARTLAAAGAAFAGPAAAELAEYAAAADTVRAGSRVNRLEFQGSAYEIARTRRLVRWGPDGPEGPRPSDVNTQDPTRLHPPLDEDGRVLPDSCAPEGGG